jgi:UDP-glucose 4-epimerase
MMDSGLENSTRATKCLVLGGGGFMGIHLCRALVEAGYFIRAFERPVVDSLAAEHARGPIEWVYGDFVNQSEQE